MKTFLILYKDKSTAKLDEDLLRAHIQHLKVISQSKNLLTCGPFFDESGAMLVIQAETYADAESLIQADPFIEQARFAAYSITEFKSAREENNFLMDNI